MNYLPYITPLLFAIALLTSCDNLPVIQTQCTDTITVVKDGNGNVILSGGSNATFYIDLDSIKVVIENDSIVEVWQRQEK